MFSSKLIQEAAIVSLTCVYLYIQYEIRVSFVSWHSMEESLVLQSDKKKNPTSNLIKIVYLYIYVFILYIILVLSGYTSGFSLIYINSSMFYHVSSIINIQQATSTEREGGGGVSAKVWFSSP